MALAGALGGCSGHSGPFSLITGARTKPAAPAPGLAAPFPHLSSVPAKPATLSVNDQQQIRAQLEAANQAGRAALAQPEPAAPEQAKPGQAELGQAELGQAKVGPAAKPVTSAPAPQAPPLLIAFAPGSAIIPRAQHASLRLLAQQRGAAPAGAAPAGTAPAGAAPAILAGGFAPDNDTAGLRLALRRALAIANQLADAGLPLADIRLAALASGRGGFAELLYDAPSHPPAAPDSVAKPLKDRP